jgi:uroporphyrinogen-III synthase
VGPATAGALFQRGIAVDVTPERFVAEGVLEAMASRGDVRGTRVLYVSAEGARDVLPNGLAKLGARVDVVMAYRSVPDLTGREAMHTFAAHSGLRSLAAFTSGSAVRAFVDAVGEDVARRVGVASIGPVTSAAARDAGLDVRVEAAQSTIPSLADAIITYGSSKRGGSFDE